MTNDGSVSFGWNLDTVRITGNPYVTAAAVESSNTVLVTFSRPMQAPGVTTATNYTVSGTGKGSFANNPNTVALVSGNQYRLKWTAGEMYDGGDITVTVAGVTDTTGLAIAPAPDNAGTHTGGAIGVPPTVSSVNVVNGTHVDVVFADVVDATRVPPDEAMGTGVLALANYTLSGSGKGSLASNPDSVTPAGGNVYTLGWSSGEMVNLGDITITVANVHDAAGNMLGSPNNATQTNGGIGILPTVTGVLVVSGSEVDVTFSEPMGVSAGTASNYTVSGSGHGSLANNPVSAIDQGGNRYRLTWGSGEMVNGGDITITVTGAQDVAGNLVGSPNSGTHWGGGTGGVPPTVTGVLVYDSTHVDVTFSELMGDGVTTQGNYELMTCTGQGSLAPNPATAALLTGNTYRLEWGSGEMKNGGDITIKVSNVKDFAGNLIGFPDTQTHTGGGIGTIPTVTIDEASGQVDPTNGSSINFTAVFSEDVTGFDQNDVTISGTAGGSKTVLVTGGAAIWNIAVSGMTTDGTVVASVAADRCTDGAGNLNVASTSTDNSVMYDNTGPAVSSVVVFDSTHVDVTFNEAIGAGALTAGNYTISGGGKGSLNGSPDSAADQGGNKYRLTWSTGEMKIGGNVTVTVSGVVDAVGNPIGVSNSGTHAGGGQGEAPVVTVDTMDPTPDTTPRVTGTVTDNVAVQGVQVTVNGHAYAAHVTGTDWYADVTDALLNGTYNVQAVATDTAGNTANDPTTNELTVNTALSVNVNSITLLDATPTNAGSVRFQVKFSSSVTGVDKTDFVKHAGSIASASITDTTGSGDTWTVTVNTGSGDGIVGVDLIDNNSILDSHSLPLGGPLPNDGDFTTGSTYAIDKTDPTVLSVDVVNGSQVNVEFSEAMGSGVTTAANYVVSGSGKGSLADNPDTVTPQGGNTFRLTWASGEMVNGGDITITVSNAQDEAGNTISGSANSGTDTGGAVGTPPEVSLVTVFDGRRVDVTFSEPMGLSAESALNYAVSGSGKGSLNNNPNSVSNQGSNKYRLSWTSGEMVASGDIEITVTAAQDAVGNAVVPPNNSATHTGGGQGVAPTVDLVHVVNGSQVDVTFSEPMGSSAGTVSNYEVSGTGKGSLASNPDSAVLQSGTTYRLTWNTGEMKNGGDITVAVSGVDDVAGNPLGSPNSGAHLIGGIGTIPTVTVNQATSQADPTNGSPINFTAVFSEDVSGFDPADVMISGTAGGTKTVGVTGVGSTYAISVTGITNGTVIASVAAAKAQDAAGNDNAESTSTDNTVTFDGMAPTVNSVVVFDSTHVDVTFSEAMGASAMTAGNYMVSGAGKGSLGDNPDSVSNQGGNKYRLEWAAGEMRIGGNVTITVANAQDLAGNAVGSPNSGTHTGGGQGEAPVVTVNAITTSDTTPRVTGTVTDNVAIQGVQVTVNLHVYTATVTGSDWYADVTNALPNGTYNVQAVATDTAGNTANDATNNELRISAASFPTVDAITLLDATPTNAGSVHFQLRFSGSVTGVDATDFVKHAGSIASASITGVTGSGDTWTVTLNTGSGDGSVGIDLIDDNSIVDALSHPLGGPLLNDGDFTTGSTYTIDKTGPTVGMSTPRPATNTFPIPVTVTFTEPVTGFTMEDILGNNGWVTPGSFTEIPGGRQYTFTLTPAGQGAVTANISAGAAQDAAGNGNSAAPPLSVTYDTVPPTVSIGPPSIGMTETGPVTYAVRYSGADVVTLTADDISLLPADVTAEIVEVSDSGKTGDITKIITIDHITADNGTAVVIRIAPGTSCDYAGNCDQGPPGGGVSQGFIVGTDVPVGGALSLGLLAVGCALSGLRAIKRKK